MNQGMQLNEGFGQTIELFRIQNVSDYLWPELQHTLWNDWFGTRHNHIQQIGDLLLHNLWHRWPLQQGPNCGGDPRGCWKDRLEHLSGKRGSMKGVV